MRRLAALLLLVLLTGCGLSAEDAPRPLEVRPSPDATPSRTGTPLPGNRPTTLYLVRDAVLAPVTRRTSSFRSPTTALQLLLRGPSAAEGDQGLTTALAPDAVLLDDVRQDGDTVVVPLRALPVDGPPRSDEVLGYAQVVTTLTALPGVRSVTFTRGGTPLAVPRADGSIATEPLTRADYASLL